MKHPFQKLFLLGSLSLLFGCGGGGSSDPVVIDSDTTVAPEISADKTTILADGAETVIFTVKANSSDVTSSAEIWNKATNTKMNAISFNTSSAGTYTFYAKYKGKKSSNEITITATNPPASTGKQFYTRACVMDFTATWCPYCPNMTNALEAASKTYSDRFYTIVIHSETSTLYSKESTIYNLYNAFNIGGFPTGKYNFRSDLTSYSSSIVLAELKKEITTHPATSGIAVSTKINANNELEVTAKVKSNLEGKYKVAIWVVEDGITRSQNVMGLYDNEYVHNGVPLKAYPDFAGQDLGTLAVNAEKIVNHTFTAEELLTTRNNMGVTTKLDYTKCRVIVYVMKMSGGKYYIDNTVSCPAKDSSIDYKYEQ